MFSLRKKRKMAIATRIKFSGIKDGKPYSFVWENGEFKAEGKYWYELYDYSQESVGGTYFPDENDTIGACHAARRFFDGGKFTLEPNGELNEMPYEEGVIY